MPRRIVSKDGPSPVDVHVGSRVRLRRVLMGMNQTQLGVPLGLTFQQVQKYELGVNRISSSRLYQLGQILDVPITFFFEGLKEGAKSWSPDDMLPKRETLEFVRAYYRITDPKVRHSLFELIQSMADSE